MNHCHYLTEALNLARIQQGFCAPNPSVGSLIVSPTGEILATGYHQGPGSPHAEVDAINKLDRIPDNAIIYVTLEPCCHTGRTPPCTNAIIASGIRHVVYAYRDPNPIVSGNGEAILKAAGITCEHIPTPEIDQFYTPYHYWHKSKKPFITAKIAITIDGMIAGKNAEPIKITGKEINRYTHIQRKNHDAILTTARTIIADDPQLNARCNEDVYLKTVYLLDSNLNLPHNAKIFSTTKKLIVFHNTFADKNKLKLLAQKGVRCIEVNNNEDGLNLEEIIRIIGEDGVHSLWIEAGGVSFNAFVKKQLLHRAYIYIAPWQLGEGVSAFQAHTQLDFSQCKLRWEQIGNDVLCEINW